MDFSSIFSDIGKAASKTATGIGNIVDDMEFADIAKGVGALATGYGGYRQAKSQEKMYNDQMNYLKSRDARYDNIEDANDKSFDDAFTSVFSDNKKKKKKKDTTTPNIETAYGITSAQVV